MSTTDEPDVGFTPEASEVMRVIALEQEAPTPPHATGKPAAPARPKARGEGAAKTATTTVKTTTAGAKKPAAARADGPRAATEGRPAGAVTVATVPLITIRGRALDHEGKPLGGLTVEALKDRDQPDTHASGRTDQDGRFTLAGVPARTGLWMRFQAEHRDGARVVVLKAPPVYHYFPGHKQEEDIAPIQYHPIAPTIEGRVEGETEPGGQRIPLSGVQVALLDLAAGLSGRVIAETMTDEKGNYSCTAEGHAEGHFGLRFATEHRAGEQMLSLARSDDTVHLRPGYPAPYPPVHYRAVPARAAATQRHTPTTAAPASPLTIRRRGQNAAGRPVGGKLIELRDEHDDGAGKPLASTLSESNGDIVLTAPRRGRYSIWYYNNRHSGGKPFYRERVEV